MVMTHSSTGYLSSEAACYAAVKVVGVQHFCQNLFYASFDTNYQSGIELQELFNKNSKWCIAYKYGQIVRKKEVKEKRQFIDLTFHFTDFDVFEVDDEKYQRFYLVITEVSSDETHEILRKEIIFDDYYFMNAVNRRVNYQSLVRTVY
jgi:hypothetical protein